MLKYIKPYIVVLIVLLLLSDLVGCSVKRVGQSPYTGGLNIIEDIKVEEIENKTKVTIVGHMPANYTAFKLANPLRIVVDIADANILGIKSPKTVSNETLDNITVTQFDETGSNIGRVEIALDKEADYRVTKDGNDIVVMVDRVPGPVVSWEKMSDADLLEPVDTLETEVAGSNQSEMVKQEEEASEKKADLEAPKSFKVEEIIVPEKVMPKATALTNFQIEKGNGYLNVVAMGNGSIGNYNAFRLGKPERLVVDIFDVKSTDKRKKIEVNDALLKTVRIGQHKDKVRIVLDKPSGSLTDFYVQKNGGSLVVVLGEKDKLPKPTPYVESIDAAKESVEDSKEAVVIDAIKFNQMPESSRVIISAGKQLEYKVIKLSPDKIAMDITSATIPKKLQRSLDTSEFNSPISLISSYQLKDGKDADSVARVVIALNKDMPYETSYENGSIYFDIERDADMEESVEETRIEVVEESSLMQAERVEQQIESTPVEEISVPAPPETQIEQPEDNSRVLVSSGPDHKSVTKVDLDKEVYSGQRISLDYKDADISNVLRLFAEVSGFNVISADDVKGTVTVKLHDVPWDQAFDIVLDAKGLGMVRKGNVMRIAPSEKIKKEEEAALAASAVKEKLENLVSEIVPVSHAPVAEMARKIEKIKTDRGSITVDERSSLLIIRDIPRVIEEARLLIVELDKPTPQVVIEARIVEVDTNHQKDLGVQWGSGYTADAAHGNALNYGFPNSMSAGIGAGGGWALNSPTAGRTGTGSGGGEAGGTIGLSFGAIDNTVSLDLKLSALESKGVSKIISRPRVVTINKQEAKIQQGLSIPFVTTSADGTKTEFIDASLELTVTPEVKQDKSIILSIKVSKNEPDFARAAAGSPSIAKKEAKTMVLIKDGDTTVIGGIFTQKEGESVAGVPILSKIPLLGWLFRSTNKTSDKAELLIFITARIVDDIK